MSGFSLSVLLHLTFGRFSRMCEYSVLSRQPATGRQASSVDNLYWDVCSVQGSAYKWRVPLLARCCFTVPSNRKSQGSRGISSVPRLQYPSQAFATCDKTRPPPLPKFQCEMSTVFRLFSGQEISLPKKAQKALFTSSAKMFCFFSYQCFISFLRQIVNNMMVFVFKFKDGRKFRNSFDTFSLLWHFFIEKCPCIQNKFTLIQRKGRAPSPSRDTHVTI